ncbi:hypothetical protein TNCV_2417511 [Trichonephila clavipes]|nr:hypothetical protein TNCV_2417511 [Trichonephila clavipes]
MKFPDSKSDDDYDFPEISLPELLEDIKKKSKESAAESRIVPDSKFHDDDATLLEKKSQGLSHNHIQPSETLPQELMKNSSDKEYSSESKRNELDISSNAKQKHDDDSQSNCKEPIKKMLCDNSATFDQSKLHEFHDDDATLLGKNHRVCLITLFSLLKLFPKNL